MHYHALLKLKANKHIFFKHLLDPMRLIYLVFILLMILIASAQCQQNAEDWFNKGLALADQDNYSDAIKAYDEAIRLDPNFAAAWHNKGNALSSQGKYDEAIKAYDEAIRLDPNNIFAWGDKGMILDRLARYDEAIQSISKAISINPGYSPYSLITKGHDHYDAGEYDVAIMYYDEAIRLDPEDASGWLNKGLALHKQDKLDEAIKCYDEVIKLNSKINLSLDSNNRTVAIRHFNNITITLLNPSYAEPWIFKGNALCGQKKYDDAIKAYDEAIRLDPNLTTAWHNKGYTLFFQDKYEEAIKAFDEAIRLSPNFVDAWINKGAALNALGRTAEANEAFTKAKGLGYSG